MRQSLRRLMNVSVAMSVWGAAALVAQAEEPTTVNVQPTTPSQTTVQVTPAPSEAPAPASEPVVQPSAPYDTSSDTNLRVTTASANEPFVDTETTRTSYPNRPLLVTGTVMLLSSYIPAVIVTAAREDDSKNLYYPVAGPWLELAREDNDELGKALLTIDGVFQGLGALSMLSSFVIPERRTQNWYLIGNNHIQLAPRIARSSVGIGAHGTF